MIAVELTLRPIEAMKIAHAKIHKFVPLKEIFFNTSSKTLDLDSSPS